MSKVNRQATDYTEDMQQSESTTEHQDSAWCGQSFAWLQICHAALVWLPVLSAKAQRS